MTRDIIDALAATTRIQAALHGIDRTHAKDVRMDLPSIHIGSARTAAIELNELLNGLYEAIAMKRNEG